MDVNQIADILMRAPIGAQKPILEPDEARIRAHWVVTDMAEIGLSLKLNAFSVPVPPNVTGRPQDGRIWVPYYELPRSDFGKDQSVGDNAAADTLTAHGTGMTWGDLVRLSKVCKIGHTLLGPVWPRKFKPRLLAEHNACIHEILWLSRFKKPANIEIEPRPFPNCKKGPDWRFTSDSQPINLEVKFRPGDWVRHVDGAKFSPARAGLLYGVAAKFPIKNAGELNLVAVTVIGPIERSLIAATDEFLRNTPTVDAVFIWSEAPDDGPPTAIRPADNNFARHFFNEGDEEDRCHIGVVRHLWRKSEERRSIRPDEVPALLKEFAREQGFPCAE